MSHETPKAFAFSILLLIIDYHFQTFAFSHQIYFPLHGGFVSCTIVGRGVSIPAGVLPPKRHFETWKREISNLEMLFIWERGE